MARKTHVNVGKVRLELTTFGYLPDVLNHFLYCEKQLVSYYCTTSPFVLQDGLEPSYLSASDFESDSSANFAIGAFY